MRRFSYVIACGSGLAMFVAGASCSSFSGEDPVSPDASTDAPASDGGGAEAGSSDPDGGDGGASGDASARRLTVFVTAATSTGRLGGKDGGDAAYAWAKATCNTEGSGFGPNRKFEPGICLAPTGPGGPKPDLLERLAPGGVWYLPNGTEPAVKRTPLLEILTRLHQRASGADVNTSVWTGCTAQGITFTGRTCESWSSDTRDVGVGQVGYTHASTQEGHLAATSDTCEKQYSILCFEIP